MENSSFGEYSDFFSPTDTTPLNTNGATSDTYKVRISGKWHFMKRPQKGFTNHPLYNAAFEKEFDIGYTLEHTNIVRYVFKGRDKEGFYFLTEYIDGKTLDDFIISNPNYFKKKEHIQKFIYQLLSALSYLHSKQILHLDLKPQNILLTTIGYDVKIVDLGFAYADCYQFLTTGKSKRYAAPEQIIGNKIDQRTDIYGIGGLLLYCFTQTLDKKLLLELPLKYRSIITKCLENDPESRFPNIESLQRHLNRKNKSKPLIIPLLIFLLLAPFLFFNQYIKKEQIVKEAMRDSIIDISKLIDTLTMKNANLEELNNPTIGLAATTINEESQKVFKLESYKIVVDPTPIEISRDSFYSVIKEKSKIELNDIYNVLNADYYSVEDQVERYQKAVELYNLLREGIEDKTIKNKFMNIFWDEQKIASAPYYQKQALSYLKKAKEYIIPDSITQKEDVFRLLDKNSADLFIEYIQNNPIVADDKQINELFQIYVRYEAMRDAIYEKYKHLYKRDGDFIGELIENQHNRINHTQDWAANILTMYLH